MWLRLRRVERAEASLLATAAFAGFAVAWIGTSPAIGTGINWDAASYLAKYASGQEGWSGTPWTSHMALGQVYLVFASVARFAGGTFIDGFRLANATALAITAGLVAASARTLSASRLFAAWAALASITAWGCLHLVFTLEDNLLFHPLAAGALLLALRRHQAWRMQDSVVAGLLLGCGTLISWQAVLYAIAPLYVAIALGGAARGRAARARDATLVIAALLAARLGWVLFYWLTSGGQALGDLVRLAFARPEPSFFPRNLGEWQELLLGWRTVIRRLGQGIVHEIVPPPPGALGPARGIFAVGLTLLAVLAASFLVTLFAARRTQRWGAHIVAATLLAVAAASALYVDLPEDRHKRYDFVPLLLPLVAIPAPASCARLPRRWRLLLVAVLLTSIMGQLWGAARWNRAWHESLPRLEPVNRFGHGGESWFAYFRGLRRSGQTECRHVFAFDELVHARFQLEIAGALWSELPSPQVIGDRDLVAGWPRPLPMVPLDQIRSSRRACDWLSPGARALLGP